jgi:hypothetical protein
MYWFTSTCSEKTRCLSRLSWPENPEPIRTDLVARVRAEIAAGTYDTPEKWDEALDRLLDRLEQA